MEIETPVLLAYAIEDSTDIFRVWGGGGGTPQTPPLGTPLVIHASSRASARKSDGVRVHSTPLHSTACVLRRYSLALQLPCHVAKVFFSVIRYHVQSVLQTALLILHHLHLAPMKICKQILCYTTF